LKESAPSLRDLTALRTGISKPMTAAEISEQFTRSVVIVRNSKSSGSGFIVGSSGLILTCAHCVSPLEPVEIVYHPPGNSTEFQSVEARIVSRDRKADLALLKIDVDQPLQAAILAPPLDAKNGEDVTVIANPGLAGEVLDNTVTRGIVSSAKRKIEDL